MTKSAPRIIDARLLQMRRGRARRMVAGVHGKPADFLATLAVADIMDRMQLMRRSFKAPLVFGCHAPELAAWLAGRPGMGEVAVADAMEFKVEPHGRRIELASLETLPVGDETFDLIVSPLMLQWVNDLPGLLLQMRRALKPDGLLIANLIGGMSLKELRASLLAGDAEVTGGARPRVLPMADVRDLGMLLQRAQFALPVVDTDTHVATYQSPLDLMRDLRMMGGTNVLVEQGRGALRRDVVAAAVEHYRRSFPAANGRVSATFEIITLTGWAPHESQQKPLEPGSAQVGLERALLAGVSDRSPSGDDR